MNSTDCFTVPLMSDADQDSEMANFFRAQREADAAEKAERHASVVSHATDLTNGEPKSESVLSRQMREVQEKVRARKTSEKLAALAATSAVLEMPAPPATPADAREGRVESEGKAAPLAVEPTPGDVIVVATPATDVARFPACNLKVVTEFEDHLKAMADLCQRQLIHKDYLRVRDAYCRHSIALNLIGKLAPAWRPQLMSGAAFNKEIHNVINRDQVVIDLHWGHTTKMPLAPQDAGHVSLFSGNENFNFELAWELARKKWKGTYRASEALCLTRLQQCQMLTLRDPELLAVLDGLVSGWRRSGGKSASQMATVNRQVTQWAERDKRIQSRRDDYVKLWLARELLGRGTPWQQIGELHALMVGGEVRDRTTIRDMLMSLDKHVVVV